MVPRTEHIGDMIDVAYQAALEVASLCLEMLTAITAGVNREPRVDEPFAVIRCKE